MENQNGESPKNESNVINFPGPYLSGTAICTSCKKEWVAIGPMRVTTPFECPHCGTIKGVYKHHTDIRGPQRWNCRCGSIFFFVLPEQIQCVECGMFQEFQSDR